MADALREGQEVLRLVGVCGDGGMQLLLSFLIVLWALLQQPAGGLVAGVCLLAPPCHLLPLLVGLHAGVAVSRVRGNPLCSLRQAAMDT